MAFVASQFRNPGIDRFTSCGSGLDGRVSAPAKIRGSVRFRPRGGLVAYARQRLAAMGHARRLVVTVGPYVEDAMTLGAIAGYDPKDPHSWEVPVPDYRQALTGDIRGLRVGVIREQMDEPSVEPEVRQAVAWPRRVFWSDTNRLFLPARGAPGVICRT